MAKSESNHGEQPSIANSGVHFPSLEHSNVQQPSQATVNKMQTSNSPPFNPSSYSIPGSMELLTLDSDSENRPLVNPYSPPVDVVFDPVVRPQTPPSNISASDNLSTTSHTSASTSKTSGIQTASANGVICMKCNLPITGQFVKAIGGIHHLECFRCGVRAPLRSQTQLTHFILCRTATRSSLISFSPSKGPMVNSTLSAKRTTLVD